MLNVRLTRRSFLLATGAVAATGLLAACDADDDSSDDDVTTDDPETEPESDSETETDPDTDDEAVDEADDTEDESVAEADDEDRYGGRLILVTHSSTENMHPDVAAADFQLYAIINNIHEPLLAVTETNEIEPALATDYDVTDDGLTYTLQLREGVKFHDGVDFTSEDVKFTYEWFMDEANAAITAADFRSVESVEAPDDTTIVINMSEPDSSLIRLALHRFIFPRHHHEELGYEGYSADPIGTGPFMLQEWAPDTFTLLGAFEDHWDGRPYLDEIEFRVIPEASVRALELETGGADSSIWALGFDDSLRLVEMTDQVQTIQTGTFLLNHFAINNEIPQFDDPRVRQALMYAVDRQQVVDTVYAGAAEVAHSCFPPGLEEYYRDDLPQYEYDPERARELLDEAGWIETDSGVRERDGVRWEWDCVMNVGDQVRRPHAEMVAEFISQVGGQMNIQEMSGARAHMRDGDGHMFLFNWNYGGSDGEPDARIGLSTGGGDNVSHYSSEEMDALLAEGVRYVEVEERREIYDQVQELFVEEVPFLYQTYWQWFNHFSVRVQGLPDADDVIHGNKLYRSGRTRKYWLSE